MNRGSFRQKHKFHSHMRNSILEEFAGTHPEAFPLIKANGAALGFQIDTLRIQLVTDLGDAFPQQSAAKPGSVPHGQDPAHLDTAVSFPKSPEICRHPVLFLKENAYLDYNKFLTDKGVVLNQIKPVTVINNEEREQFFFSHVATDAPVVKDVLAKFEK